MSGSWISLNGEWDASGHNKDASKRFEFKGIVPGSVHSDLLRNGLIPDPFYGLNAEECMFPAEWEWRYSKTFEIAPDVEFTRAELEFSGLDTYCHIYFNGNKIASTDNMFTSHIFDVGGFLHAGTNFIDLIFMSPEDMVRHKNMRNLKSVFGKERLFIRRMQCTFGWDWVHKLITMGVWRPVTLYFRDIARIDSIYAFTNQIDGYGAEIVIETEATTFSAADLFAETVLRDPDGKIVWKNRRLIKEMPHVETASVANPELWWPAGHGSQPIYSAEVLIEDGNGKPIDSKTVYFGIRTIRVLRAADPPGSPEWEMSVRIQSLPGFGAYDKNTEFSGFFLLINGEKIICKGADWVPADPFPGIVPDDKYKELIRLASEGSMNMLRVWGGGIYEDEAFYDACDRAGVMLTQDFMMACGSYPEEDRHFMKQMKSEAEFAVKTLRNHPSLVWWTGDNENAMLGSDNNPNDWGRKTARTITGEAVRIHDRKRPFFPSSPWGGKNNSSLTAGTTHFTVFLAEFIFHILDTDMKDYVEFYGKPVARFSPETPALGTPALSSLRKFMTDEQIFGDDENAWQFHTKNHPGREFSKFTYHEAVKMMASKLFGDFTDPRDKLKKMQLVQYEWVRVMTESFRRNNFYSGGNLFWMFNDCWPAMGWSLIDYYCVPKGGWYAHKRAGANISASIAADGTGGFAAWVCNCGLHEAKGALRLYAQPFDDPDAKAEWKTDFVIPPNTSLPVIKVEASDAGCLPDRQCVLVCDIDSDMNGEHFSDRAFLMADLVRNLNLPDAHVVFERRGGESEGTLAVSSDVFAYGVQLDGEYIFSDNYFNLNPHETRIICYRTAYRSVNAEITAVWINGR